MKLRHAVGSLCALSTLFVLTGPALPALAASGPILGVTVFLTPQDPAGLKALAHAHRLGAPERRARLVMAEPSDATANQTRNVLLGFGLHVDPATRFSVHATGPASVIAAAFGSTRDSSGTAGRVGLHIPASLVGLVNGVVGGDDLPVQALPASTGTLPTVDGPRARQLYSTPFGPVPAGMPTPTIATIQFSGFDTADLTQYAQESGLPDPVASGQFVAYSVDGADPSTPASTVGGKEVDLDQQSLLSTAPQANQHAYFAPNSFATGFPDVITAIASDAANGTNDGFSLTSASLSWGACETKWSGQQIAGVSQAITNLLATGVTLFAATGDHGAYDCSTTAKPDSTLTVEYPASDPQVVAVGGTTVAADDSQSVWFTPDSGSHPGYAGDGGGGGFSAVWTRPTYQDGVVATNSRVIPDISLEADPHSGFPYVYQGVDGVIGGTSLATPFAAATFTDMLVDAGIRGGVGDILAKLYAAPASAFTDITAGNNGNYAATVGFDAASGLGAPLWTNLEATLTNSLFTGVPTARVFDGMVGTTPRVVPIAGLGGVPRDATAVAVNVEVFNPSADGYVRITPAGQDASVAVQEFSAGQNISNLVVVKLVGGALQVKVSSGSARILMDVSGYYASSGDSFSGLPTARVFDGMVSTTPRVVPIAGLGGVPRGATAVAVNVEVFNPSADGYVRITPAGQDASVAVQEFSAGQNISNLVVVKLVGGALQVKVSSGSARILMDVSGYYASSGDSFSGLPTARVFDGGVGTTPRVVPIAGLGGVPSGATAVVVNVEVFNPSSDGYVRITPAGQDASVAVQEFSAGQNISNLVVVKLVGGALQVKVSSGSARVLMDVSGYYIT